MTTFEEKWLRKNFPNMSNATCGVYLGKHPRTIVRMARKLGLAKSPTFLKLMQEVSLKKAAETNSKRMKGIYPMNLQRWNNRNKTI